MMKAWMLMTIIIAGPVFAKESKSLSYKEIIKVKRVLVKPVKETNLSALYRPLSTEIESNYRRPAILE